MFLRSFFAVLACSFLVPFSAFAASYSIAPTLPSLGVGCIGSANIWINAAGDPVNAGNVIIRFDPTKVGNVKLVPGSYFESYADNVVQGDIARLTGFSVSSSPTGSGLFAKLTYKTLSSGSAPFSFVFSPGLSTDSNIASTLTSNDLLTGASGASLTVTNEPCPSTPKPAASPETKAVPKELTADSCASLGCTSNLICEETVLPDVGKSVFDCSMIAGKSYYSMALPHSTVKESRLSGEAVPAFTAFQKQIVLPKDEQVYTAPQDMLVYITATQDLFSDTPREMQLLIDNTQYVASFLEEDRAYELTFHVPEKPGVYDAALVYFYKDKTREVWPFYLRVEEIGGISGVALDDRLNGDVRVTLQNADGETWLGSIYGQENPIALSAEDDGYVFVVPEGTYRLKAEFPGYADVHTSVFESDGVVNEGIIFVAPFWSHGSTVGEYVSGSLDHLRYDPFVERTMKKLTWLLMALALLLTVIFSRHHWSYVRHLWWRVRLARFKGHLLGESGMVYNSKNKEPVFGVLIRLFDLSSGKLLCAGFSRRQGKISFFLPLGSYRLQADAVGYVRYEEEVLQKKDGLLLPSLSLKPRHSTRLEFGYPYATIWFVILVGVMVGGLISFGVFSIERTPWAIGMLWWFLYLAGLAHLLLRRHRVG